MQRIYSPEILPSLGLSKFSKTAEMCSCNAFWWMRIKTIWF
jgi:hypothetical protein